MVKSFLAEIGMREHNHESSSWTRQYGAVTRVSDVYLCVRSHRYRVAKRDDVSMQFPVPRQLPNPLVTNTLWDGYRHMMAIRGLTAAALRDDRIPDSRPLPFNLREASRARRKTASLVPVPRSKMNRHSTVQDAKVSRCLGKRSCWHAGTLGP